jgi:hypothetical protein
MDLTSKLTFWGFTPVITLGVTLLVTGAVAKARGYSDSRPPPFLHEGVRHERGRLPGHGVR